MLASPAPGVDGLLRPETVAVRRDAVQKRLETLEHLLLSQEEAEAVKATLDQHVKTRWPSTRRFKSASPISPIWNICHARSKS